MSFIVFTSMADYKSTVYVYPKNCNHIKYLFTCTSMYFNVCIIHALLMEEGTKKGLMGENCP